MNKRALFLDRDGVINVDHGYVHTLENFHFVDGIFDLVRTANQVGFLVVVVTNQSGIGRGFYTELQFHELTCWMRSRFLEHGASIDAVYYCPFHPESAISFYRCKSHLRKPASGMIIQAKHDHCINLNQSILVGDQLTDIAAGHSAQIHTLLHLSDDASTHGSISIKSLAEAIPYLYN